MKRRLRHGFVALLLSAASFPPASADETCEPVDRVQGKSVVLKGLLLPEQTRCYALRLASEQGVVVRVLKDDNIRVTLHALKIARPEETGTRVKQLWVQQKKRTVAPQYYRLRLEPGD